MTTAPSETLLLSPNLPQEENSEVAHSEAGYRDLLAQLSRVSVTKHFDAYADVPWDDPEYAVQLEDPRWVLHDENPLGSTAWYRSQPEAIQARIGVHMTATFMKIGSQFESVLKRGLLEFATRLPNQSPEFRYVYHEVIEEAQHSLMFQEFVNRTGLDIPGLLSPVDHFLSRRIVAMGRTFPELFFVFVLGGEDPIDYQQRVFVLGSNSDLHPLLRRVSQIHVTEEARHLSFARAYLRRHVPSLSKLKMTLLRLRTPLLLGNMAKVMMEPSPQLVREYAIPKSALHEAYRANPEHRSRIQDALAKVRDLCSELEILTPPFDRLWYRMGIAPRA